MGKSKSTSKNRISSLPKAPFLYINDTTYDPTFGDIPLFSGDDEILYGDCCIDNLLSFIPAAEVSPYYATDSLPSVKSSAENIVVFVDREPNLRRAVQRADTVREAAIQLGKNFTSINLIWNPSGEEDGKKVDWGTNHLDVDTTDLTSQQVAEKIFKWLFTVLTVPETLHLIPEADMRVTDDNFADYAYCPINESRKYRKDAKIQFVALIVSKPEVGPDQRLQWKVVDRTGEANFFFQWRGADSKATWDWVLKLQPGDRKALPRMPMVHIKEKKRVQVIKAPFRGVAAVVGGAGTAIKGVGKGLCWVGEKARMGPSGLWVAEADIGKDGKITGQAKHDRSVGAEKKGVTVFNEKGELKWKDDVHDDTSTTAGSIYDEKAVKEFC